MNTPPNSAKPSPPNPTRAERANRFAGQFVLLPPRLPQPSRLALWIAAANMVVIVGVAFIILSIDDSREELIDVRINAMIAQAEIIAGALGEGSVVGEETMAIDLDRANAALRRLVVPTGARARLYSDRGRLMADSRLLNENQVEVFELAPIGTPENKRSIEDVIYGWLVKLFFRESLPIYKEFTNQPGTDYPEIRAALEGRVDSAKRQNVDGKLVVSVGVPVRRFKIVLGALLVSAEGGDIDGMVRENRMGTLKVLLLGVFASLCLSFILFLHIARPLRALARTADDATTGTNFARVEIPDMKGRRDEIGDLSVSLRTMVSALYNRIEAIESFAADVSHEIKNPLTSIRSAVETLELAKNEEGRKRLTDLIQNDVGRLDRLITDISDASRLDAELARETSHHVNMRKLLETMEGIYANTRKDDGPIISFHVTEPEIGTGRYNVIGIESRLGQVIRNLIANAQSFSQARSKIELNMKCKVHLGKEYIWITVDDEGPGIPVDNLETIFNRFYTERPDPEEFGKNSGLGLSISRQIVEAHEGNIWAENRVDDTTGAIIGARFVVIIPTKKQREGAH